MTLTGDNRVFPSLFRPRISPSPALLARSSCSHLVALGAFGRSTHSRDPFLSFSNTHFAPLAIRVWSGAQRWSLSGETRSASTLLQDVAGLLTVHCHSSIKFPRDISSGHTAREAPTSAPTAMTTMTTAGIKRGQRFSHVRQL